MPQKTRTRPRKSAKQSRSQDTVSALIEATTYILARDGYEHASTNRIAERAGVNIGSLYQYFPNKDALVAAVVDREVGAYVRAMEGTWLRVAQEAPREAFPLLIRAHLERYAKNPQLHRMLLTHVPRVERLDYLHATRSHLQRMCEAYLSLHRPSLRVGSPAEAAFVTVHVVDALTNAALFESRDFQADPWVPVISDVVCRYLLA